MSYRLRDGQIYTIRRCTVDDAESLLEYIYKVAGESDNLTFGEGEVDISIEEERELIKSSSDSNRYFIIAEYDGEIIGNLNFVASKRPRIKHAGEFGVSVVKEFWGNGIATELINNLIEWAKHGGYIKKINLRVREDNDNALKLYKKLGFEVEGMQSRTFCINDKYYATYSMGLEL